MPEHIWKAQDPTKYKDNPPVHSGPYKLKQAIRNQKMFVWEKDPNYWNKDKLDVKPQYVVYQSTSKQLDQASLAFERAEFDVGSVDEQHAKQLRNTGYPALQTTQFHDPNPRVMWLNCDPSRGVISEPKMRWAINYCLDREKIGKSIWPVPVPPAQYPWADYPTNDKWKNDELANKYKFEFNPDKATQLLDEIAPKNAAGKRTYKGKEINLEIITPSPVDGGEYAIANVLKTELAKVGVPATLRSLAGNVHDEKFQRGQYDIDSSWAGIAVDPEQLYSDWTSDKYQPVGKNAAGKNKLRYRNPKFDEISEKLAQLDPNSEEAKPLLEPGAGDLLPGPADAVGDPDRLPVVLQHDVLEGLADRRRPVRGPAELVAALHLRARQDRAHRAEGTGVTAEAPPAVAVDKSQDSAPVSGVRAWLSRHPLAAYAIRRFGLYLIELWGALTIAFFFFRLMPGDPIQTLIQTLQQNYIYNAQASTEIIARYKHEFGLDGNLLTQYLTYMQKLILHGDLGPSLINYPTPAQTVILRSLPWTIGLLGISAVLAWILGIAIGAVAGWRRGKAGSAIATNLSIALSHVPYFFVALVLVYIFAYSMGVLPARSAYDSNINPGISPQFIGSVLKYGLLPGSVDRDHRDVQLDPVDPDADGSDSRRGLPGVRRGEGTEGPADPDPVRAAELLPPADDRVRDLAGLHLQRERAGRAAVQLPGTGDHAGHRDPAARLQHDPRRDRHRDLLGPDRRPAPRPRAPAA